MKVLTEIINILNLENTYQLPYKQWFFQAGRYATKWKKPSSMRVHVTPMSKRQISLLALVSQETLGTSNDATVTRT